MQTPLIIKSSIISESVGVKDRGDILSVLLCDALKSLSTYSLHGSFNTPPSNIGVKVHTQGWDVWVELTCTWEGV